MSQWEKSRHLPSSWPLPSRSTYRKIERGVVARWLVPSLTRTTNPTKAGGPQWFLLDFTGCLKLQERQNVNFPISLFSSRNMRYIKTPEFSNWLIIWICFGKTVCKNVAIFIIIFANCNELRYFQCLHLWSDDTVAIIFLFYADSEKGTLYLRQAKLAGDGGGSKQQPVCCRQMNKISGESSIWSAVWSFLL